MGRSNSLQFLVKMLASYTDMPRLLPTILSFNIEAFVFRNSDISPYEADRRKSRPIHHEASRPVCRMHSDSRKWAESVG